MLDDNPAQMGHNNPPAYDQAKVDELAAKVEEFMDASKVWLNLEAVADDQQAEQLSDQIVGLRGLHKKVDEARKAAKKPHDDAGKAVQAAFTPLTTKLKAAADKLKPKLEQFVTAKAEAERKRRAEEERQAQAEAEAAEERARIAEAEGDISAQIEAEQAAQDAAKAANDAAKPVKANVGSASGGGRTMAVREIKEASITNARLLFMHFQDAPEVLEVLQRLANQAIRAKGYDAESNPIPGIKITTRQQIA